MADEPMEIVALGGRIGSASGNRDRFDLVVLLRGNEAQLIDLIDQLECETTGGSADRIKRQLCERTGLVDPGPVKPAGWGSRGEA